MPITKGSRQLVEEASAQITTYTVEQVRARMGQANLQLVDIRDVRELEREGLFPALFTHREACWSSGLTRRHLISSRFLAMRARSLCCSVALAGAAR